MKIEDYREEDEIARVQRKVVEAFFTPSTSARRDERMLELGRFLSILETLYVPERYEIVIRRRR